MSIIRGAKIEDTVIFTSKGELISHEERGAITELFEEEINRSFKNGFEKGESIGYEKGLAEGKVLLNLLQKMADKLLEQKEKLLDQLKPEMIEFSLKVCERIIRRELSQPESLAKLISSLLSTLDGGVKSGTIDIFLSSEDVALLQNHHDQINLKGALGFRLIADPLVRRGDVRIENKMGLLNYDISRELAELQMKILQK